MGSCDYEFRALNPIGNARERLDQLGHSLARCPRTKKKYAGLNQPSQAAVEEDIVYAGGNHRDPVLALPSARNHEPAVLLAQAQHRVTRSNGELDLSQANAPKQQPVAHSQAGTTLGVKSLQFLPHDVLHTEHQIDQRPSAAPKGHRQRPEQG